MSPEAVISGAVSNGFAAELKRIRGVDGEGWGRITTPGEDVEDHIGRMDALGQRLGAGGFHGVQPVGEDRDEDVDHLAVTIIDTAQLPAHPLYRRGQFPFLERCAVPQSPRFAGQNRHVMPRIVNRLAPSEGAVMSAHHLAVLPKLHALGIRADLHGTANRARHHRVFVVVKANEAGLRYCRRGRLEPVEGADRCTGQ